MKYYNLNSLVLKQKMQESRLSSKQIAKIAKRSIRTIQRMISGKQEVIDYFVLIRIANKLKISSTNLTKFYTKKQIDKIFGNDDIQF